MAIIAKIELSLHDNGNVTITGPTDQRLLCYGLLEMGKEMLAASARKVQPASLADQLALK